VSSTVQPDLRLTQLRELEAESVYIVREVAAEFERPVLPFSGGKDSIVLLRLAEKAVIDETAATRLTERGATRADDRSSEAAMEDRKREGYF
jgi:3'-phosphoadenosine 5'-phosphosulfate sulfotransferase (PAPS reductase)/FAD synthetase